MSRDQHAGHHVVKTDDKSLETEEQFKYLVTNLTHKNSITAEIKSKLRFGNAYYHSIQPSSIFQYAIQVGR